MQLSLTFSLALFLTYYRNFFYSFFAHWEAAEPQDNYELSSSLTSASERTLLELICFIRFGSYFKFASTCIK